MAIEGVLLDIDGTLLLSNELHARAWRDALEEFGYAIPVERIQPLIGMGGDKVLPTLVPDFDPDSPRAKELSKRRGAIFQERYSSQLAPAPGARALLIRLRDEGVRRIVATSAPDHELKPLLEAAQVSDLIEETATSTDAEESKPEPDIVHAALAKAGLVATRAIMLGDTPYDLEAAAKAGVGVIAVRCGGWDDAHLAGALAIYDDPADLLAHYETSPLAG